MYFFLYFFVSQLSCLKVNNKLEIPINYNIGNPVMTNDVNIYHIYYGKWNSNASGLFKFFALNIGKSNWYKTNLNYYYQASSISEKIYVNDNITFIKSIYDNYSQGNIITNVWQVVVNQFNKGLKQDDKAIYFVLTSPDVTINGFCTSFCGFHSSNTFNNSVIKYSFVGIPSNSCTGCIASNFNVSPNNQPFVDAAISVYAHELVETISDPQLNSWYDSQGNENGDKCAWKFGTTTTLSSGAIYNEIINKKKFLIQMNWNPVKNMCTQ